MQKLHSCPKSVVVRSVCFVFTLITCFCLSPGRVAANVLSWSGGGAPDFNWGNANNWGGAGVPGNGDTIIFQGPQPGLISTNNIGALTLNQIRFIGTSGGFDIRGLALTVTNGIENTNAVGVNEIENAMTLPASNLAVDVQTGTKLILFGVLSGPGGLVKNGGGTNTLAGPSSNTYLGTTTVNAGLMELDKIGIPIAATAIPGNLVVGDGVNSPTVRNLANLEIADSGNVTVNVLGTWDLNNWAETVGPNLVINGVITTGTGTCILSPNASITSASGQITGNLNIGSGTCTIEDDGSLTLNGVVSGTANIIKNGTGDLALFGANTFTGSFTANGQSYVWVTTASSLGVSATPAIFNDQTWLAISGNINITNALTMNSPYANGTLYEFDNDTNTLSGPLVLNTNITIECFTNCGLVLSGSISGPGGFTKLQTGVLTLSCPGNSSSYLGDTTVNDGILFLNSFNVIRHGTLTIGDGNGPPSSDIVRYLTSSCIYGGPGGSTVVIKNSGLLDLNNFTDDVGPVAIDGAGSITTGTGVFTLFQPFSTYSSQPTNGIPTFSGSLILDDSADNVFAISNDIVISGSVSSFTANALIKTGPGTMYFPFSNSYTGPTYIQQGLLYCENAWSLGNTNTPVVVSNNATLALSGAFGVTNKPAILNGPGVSIAWGAFDVETLGSTTWAGPITVNADSTITAYDSSGQLHIVGGINGAGGVTTLAAGQGSIYYEGSTSNTYAGLTRVYGGTLLLNKLVVFDGAVPNDLIIGDGLGGANSDVVRWLQNNQVPNTANVTINSSGLLDLNTSVEGLGTLSGNGNLALGTLFLDLYNTSTCTFNGVISGPGFFRQVSAATGTITLNGNNTYAGQTLIAGGTMIINGQQPQSPVTVSAGATLAGSGAVGNISCQGNLSPGTAGPGILTCSNLALAGTAKVFIDLEGPLAGSGYDQLNVFGTNNLASAQLQVNPAFSQAVAVGSQLTFINNHPAGALVGTFSGWPSGTSFTANGISGVLSYTGGTGNDAVFTITNVPGASGSWSVSSGNGDHLISPNECNTIDLVLSNKTGSAMTGITAVLSSPTIGVVVNQPYSSYADMPASGSGTNITSFQVSTLTNFSCGTDIELDLAVNTTSHGSFVVPFIVPTGEISSISNRTDMSTVTNIPDIGSIDSTNVVTGFAGPLGKVVVMMWLTHPVDSDLTITLFNPDGVSAVLTAGNGSGANFGTSCSPDSSRTTFDDDAATSILAGSPPFVGTFQPQGSFANIVADGAGNGIWRLHVTDSFGGSVGALRCWSLLLYPTTCPTGSGFCDTCLPAISNAITAASLTQNNRTLLTRIVSTCAEPKSWSGFGGPVGAYHYQAFTFTNTSPENACVSIELQSTNDLMALAYLNSFNPTTISNNFLGDSGYSTGTGLTGLNGTINFSVTVPAGAPLIVVVHETTANSGTQPFALSISGLPCPPPVLAIDPQLPDVRLHWPTWAGGYNLEATPSLNPATWTTVTNEPIDTLDQMTVTNDTSPTDRFYRLHKP